MLAESRLSWVLAQVRARVPRVLALVPVSLLIVACEAAKPAPEPIDAESAGLGISLEMTEMLGPLRGGIVEPEIVLFVRLEPGEEARDLSQKRVLIPSTFVSDGTAYLLNVSPGSYAAVAALYGEDVGPTYLPLGTANVGSHTTVSFSLELSDGKTVHRNYFSRMMIEKSLTTVAAGSFAFMGSYAADQSFRFGEADDLQVHFLHALEGEEVDRSGLMQDISSEGRAHRLTLCSAARDRKAEIAFCNKAKDRLEDTGWVRMIDGLMAQQ